MSPGSRTLILRLYLSFCLPKNGVAGFQGLELSLELSLELFAIALSSIDVYLNGPQECPPTLEIKGKISEHGSTKKLFFPPI